MPSWHMSEDEVAKLQAASAKSTAGTASGSFGIGKGGSDWKRLAVSCRGWAFVGIPLAWGVRITLKSAAVLFQ